MKMMGKILNKMIGETEKQAFDEMIPELLIRVNKDGTATVEKVDEKEDGNEEMKEELEDRSPQYVEEKE